MTGLWALLQQCQTFIAGVLLLVVGAVAYVGVLVAASRQAASMRLATDHQVIAMRRAAEQQVAAVRRATDQQVAAIRRATHEQVASIQGERRQIDERQPIEWNVQIRDNRIEIAAVTRDAASPDRQRDAALPIARLVVESDPFPHRGREEMALLDERMRAVLEELGGVIDEYYSRAKKIDRFAALARVAEPVER